MAPVFSFGDALIVACLITPSILFVSFLNPQWFRSHPRRKTVDILVLGEVGRSPRMMYHAESFAKEGWEVRLIGYSGAAPIPSLLTSPNVEITHLPSPPKVFSYLPFILSAPPKVVLQVLSLIYALIWRGGRNPQVLLVQNPPAIPTLLIAQLSAHLLGSHLIIDWHNTGYSILALKTGVNSPIYKFAKWYEGFYGQEAWGHLFVSKAMKEALSEEWRLKGELLVLHDKAGGQFRRIDAEEKHDLFRRLTPAFTPPLPASYLPDDDVPAGSTIFTSPSPEGFAVLNPERPCLLVSSTSWTPDEDFSLLLASLDSYNSTASSRASLLPRLLVLISGRGPLRAQFETVCRERESLGKWTRVCVRCVWLEAEDYPKFLASADLGVSMHQSSSGVDLPMKVVDMFGCGVPVLARNFACLGELVKDGKNGMVFEDSFQLTSQLEALLREFPNAKPLQELQSFFPETRTTGPGAHGKKRKAPSRRPTGNVVDKEDLLGYEWETWEGHWKDVVGPLLAKLPS